MYYTKLCVIVGADWLGGGTNYVGPPSPTMRGVCILTGSWSFPLSLTVILTGDKFNSFEFCWQRISLEYLFIILTFTLCA